MSLLRYAGVFSSETVIAVEATAPNGKPASRTITLPDGSTVVLGAASELVFNTDDWQNKGDDSERSASEVPREVRLTGEAFFVVKKQERAGQLVKFRVRTADAIIEVLGTQFNVNTRRERTAVVLQEGKVRVLASTASQDTQTLAELRPNERAEISAQGTVTKRAVRAAVYTSWKDGKLVFESTPLAEVARVLEDRTNTRVVLDSSLANRTFTGAAPVGNPDLLLRAIGESFAASITRTPDAITIAPRH
jgi:transmembrane sensor